MSKSELFGRIVLVFIIVMFVLYRVVPLIYPAVWKLGNISEIRDLNADYQAARAITEQDRDWMTRTVFLESLGEPREAQIAVAHVIKNRWIKSPYTNWTTISKVVSACGFIKRNNQSVKVCQFEPWLSKAKKKRMFDLKTDSQNYAHFRAIVDDVLDETIDDNVDGRRCFMNVSIVKRRKGKVANCENRDCLVFPDSEHTFYRCKGWPRI